MRVSAVATRFFQLVFLNRGTVALFVAPMMTAFTHPLLGWPLATVITLQCGLLWWVARFEPTIRHQLERQHGAALVARDEVEMRLAMGAAHGRKTGTPASLVVRIDEAPRLEALHGARFLDALAREMAVRLSKSLRTADLFCQIDRWGLGVALWPQAGLNVGSVLGVAQRVQAALALPFTFETVTHWPTVSVGFCASPRAAMMNGLSMLDAADAAALRALRSGPSGLSSYSAVDFPTLAPGSDDSDLARALDSGEIRPYFQPQIATATGLPSGIEALARWQHPQRGLIPPGEFLPRIEKAGLLPRLAQTMLRESLKELARLDTMGLHVPTVAVNLSSAELRNPNLADEIQWELDKAGLTPDRLVLEILETVVADSDDDMIVRTIARLARLGCGIDLDDFGTGHASIANIRRFAVGRLKIDRSFVTKLHTDPDQQRMVSAIISMAGQLELGTLAEGVECANEQVVLAQLGCQHLQGFGIARPMSAEALPDWLRNHFRALEDGEPWCEEGLSPATPSASGQAGMKNA
ncbi:MAG: GGDEF domain-containing phosphodiesterase [Paracoccaceae bacterium]